MKKLFLLFALILIFSVPACGGKSKNQKIPEQNDVDETAETVDNKQNDDDNEQNNNEDDNEILPDPCEPDPCKEIPHAGECKAHTSTTFICKCTEGWFWNGKKCIDLPECSLESGTPCKDSVTGLIWSTKLFDDWKMMKCSELSEGGFTDWRRPTISQLRTLIQNCPGTETDGECPIYDEYLNENTCGEKCSSCEERDSGKYSKFGDTEIFWSSTLCSEFYVVNFSNGAIYSSCNFEKASWSEYMGQMLPTDCTEKSLRCTRCDEGYFWYNEKCIESPCKSNPCGEIPHIYCAPLSETNYRCTCETGYYLNGEECVPY